MTEQEMMMNVLRRFSTCSVNASPMENGNQYVEAYLDCGTVIVVFDPNGNIVNMDACE